MIPNIIHLCYGFADDFDSKPFSLVHYLTVKSAVEVHRPEAVRLYYRYEPLGFWWERARPYLELVPTAPPREVAGVPIRHCAHQTDLLRLQVLYQHGGIYLDMDVLSLRSFAPLRGNACVLAQEGVGGSVGLCNAVILAAPRAPFLDLWIKGFDPRTSLWRGFRSAGRDEHWNEYAVRYPAFLAERFPQHVTVLGDKAFFWPTWTDEHLALLFGPSDLTLDDSYCVHLWEQKSWERFLDGLTVEEIRRVDTPFNRLARQFLDDL